MSKTVYHDFVSPIGRFVEGDLWKPNDKDYEGNPLVYKNGENAGQPRVEYYLRLAFPKLVRGQPNADWERFRALLEKVAREAKPEFFRLDGSCAIPNFSWKINDGDTDVIRAGKNIGTKLSDKPGFAGHYVVGFSSSYAPQIVMQTSPNVYAEVTDRNLIKRGYYLRVGGTVSYNGSTGNPGIYLNLQKVLFYAPGEVIETGKSAAELFGSQQATVEPEGVMVTPDGFASSVVTGFSELAPPPAAYTPSPAPAAPPLPAPAVPSPALAAPLPPGAYSGFMGKRVMLPKAEGQPYEALIAAGWTDDLLVQHGMMAAM